MRMKKSYLWLIVALLLLYFPAAAKETGRIEGKVIDEQGETLQGVEITARSPNLQGTRFVVSGKNGRFLFPLLPVGTYSLTAKFADFQPVIQKNIIVQLGSATFLTIILNLSEVKEEITVSAPTPLINITSTDTSYHIRREDLEKLPVQNRTIVDLIKFTPGVTGVRVNTRRGTGTEGQPSFRGEGEEGNNWIVDGLSISGVRMKNSGVRMNFDSIDEIQVISDPFSPEYGSAYGGIINMVTKSGSNDFSGEFSLVFMDKKLQAERQDQLSVVSEPEYFSNYNWYFNLGGPIIKDKLWFFISNNVFSDSEQTRDTVVDYLFVPGGNKTIRFNNLFTKLSFALNTNHSLSLTGIYQTSLGQKGGTGIPELFTEKTFSDKIFRLNYKGILNSSTFIEAGLGQITREGLERPIDEDLGPAMYYIEDLGRNINNSYGNVIDDQKRLDLNVKITKHFDSETLGAHEIVLGLEYYSISSRFGVDFSGENEDLFPDNGFDAGTKYYFSSWKDQHRIPTFFYEYGVFDFINSSRGFGLFFKDKLRVGRFTFMAGLRSQTQLNLDNNKKKLWSWGIGDFMSPRFSMTFDITGDGANVLKLGWGRFSDLITTMPLGLLNSGAGLTFRTYRWNGPQSPDDSAIHDSTNWIFENEQKTQPFVIAKNIEPNFLTRYLIEYDRRLGPEWAFLIRYVQTKASDLLEALAVFDIKTQYKFLYDNFEHKQRKYHGLEMELRGKIGQNLVLRASYSYSSSKGTNPGQSETGSWSQEEGSTNYLGLFGNHINIPDMAELAAIKAYYDWALGGLGGRGIGDEGWYGKLPYSVNHNFKVHTIYLAPFGLSFSAALEWISGYPWEKLGYVPFFGGYYAFPEGRGTRKTPSHFYLDISVEKDFYFRKLGLPQDLALSLRFDVLNLFNSQTPISYVKENIPIFGHVWGRQQPRQARVMIKVKF